MRNIHGEWVVLMGSEYYTGEVSSIHKGGGGGGIVIKGSKTDSPLLLLPKNDQFLKIDHISRVMSLTLS